MKSLIGKTFGSLTVTIELERRTQPNGVSVRYFEASCVCGCVKAVSYGNLTFGTVKSCGCIRPAGKYGPELASTRAMKRWRSMLSRMQRKERKQGYKHVTLHPDWNDFRKFFADLGECPPGFSIERIENSKGYEPGNCRWADVQDQANNKGRSVRLLVGGNWVTTKQAAIVLGLTVGQVQGMAVSGKITKRRLIEIARMNDTTARAPVLSADPVDRLLSPATDGALLDVL